MAAPLSERLFSLELLVDWVRLEAGPPPQPGVEEEKEEEKEEEEEEEEQEEASSRAPCPAVAFRLLDFPTLLVYPPGGPGAAAPQPRPGLLSFGRGKSCLFRLHPATLRCRLLATPLYALLLRLPPGRPTPAPRLLGTCSISLAAAALEVLGPAASCCSHGHRGRFPLHNHVGERVGDMALAYRLTDLGSSLLGHLERPLTSAGGGVRDGGVRRAVEGRSPAQQERQLPQPHSDPSPRDPDGPAQSFNSQEAQRDSKEVVFRPEAKAGSTGSADDGNTESVCSDASCVGRVSPPDQEVPDLDLETNTFCPPPLYYTHVTPDKRPPLPGKVTIKPQVNVSEELDGAFPEATPVRPPTHMHLLTHTDSAARETPAALNPAGAEDIEANHQSTGRPQPEPNRMNTIRQLPLLNALLVELSLLYNQPVASPTHIHPHLAWLYRPEGKKSPESSAKSTAKSESKERKFPVGGDEKPLGLQCKKNQDENLQKGKYLEKNHGAPSKKAPRGKLLYGLTNTLKLRLKQTNPGMLVVHERREQYRKMQAQVFGAKARIPSSRVPVPGSAGQRQKPHRLPADKSLESDTSSAENGDSSKLLSGAVDGPSTTKETQPKCAVSEETVEGSENRTSDGALEEIVSPANPMVPERFAHTNILEEKVETKVQSPFVFQQVAALDKIVGDKDIEDKTTDNEALNADAKESQPRKYSCSESISELKYSDDFTSPCYSEDFCTDDTSRVLQAHDTSPSAENSKHSQRYRKSSATRLSIRKNSHEQSFIPTPPFSAGSPVLSSKRFHVSKTRDESLEEASTLSTSDLSSCWTEEKENQLDQNSVHLSNVPKTGQDSAMKTRADCRSLERSQSIRTSQVSSYLPSNLSECSKSDHFEEDSDEIASLNISEQCKDICELLVNKLPGYTV